MSDCPQFGKWIGGCRFEPRYDEGGLPSGFDYEGRSLVPVLKAAKTYTYVKDVCVRCGKEIKR